MTSYDVCAIGNAIVDMIEPCTEDFLTKEGIQKASMTLIDRDRARNLTNLMREPEMTSGGSAANTIAGIVACGGRAAFIGKVAQDALGRVFHDDLVRQGVAYRTPYYAGGDLETARCHIFVTPDGERSMNTYLGVSTDFMSSDLDEEMIKSAQITYLEGYLYDKDAAREAFGAAAKIAKAAGRKVAMTLSDAFCVDRHREHFLELIDGNIDILFANESEMVSLAQTPDIMAAIDSIRAKVPLLAVTRSEKGALVVEGSETHEIKTPVVQQVVDATGAGDQFAAGFLYGLTHNMPLPQAGQLGCQMASAVIRQIGPRLKEDPKPWVKSVVA